MSELQNALQWQEHELVLAIFGGRTKPRPRLTPQQLREQREQQKQRRRNAEIDAFLEEIDGSRPAMAIRKPAKSGKRGSTLRESVNVGRLGSFVAQPGREIRLLRESVS